MATTRTKTRTPGSSRKAEKAKMAETRRAARMQDFNPPSQATATAGAGAAASGSNPGELTPSGLATVLFALSDPRVKGAGSAGVRNAAEATRNLLVGAQADYAAPDSDQLAAARRGELARAGVTVDRLATLGKGAVAMLDLEAEVEQAKLAWRAKVTQLSNVRAAVEGDHTRIAAGVRSAFGNTATDLTRYGVARIGITGGHNKGAGKAKGKGSTPQAAPATPQADGGAKPDAAHAAATKA